MPRHSLKLSANGVIHTSYQALGLRTILRPLSGAPRRCRPLSSNVRRRQEIAAPASNYTHATTLRLPMKPKPLRCLAITFAALVPLLAHAQWVPNGREVMFTMYLPQAKKPDTNAIFVISYEKRWSCRPAISVMLMTGRKLGTPERQATERKREDQLLIVIDGRVFTDETKVTMYSNAMELAMSAPPGLIDAMK